MATHPTLSELWNSTPTPTRRFDPDLVRDLPDTARRWLTHAIAPETPLARAVRLRMHGEIRLEKWLSFEAEQVIRWDRGMIWEARTRMAGLPIRGWDRLVDGEGAMRWTMLGLIPVLVRSGPDITRSAAGRIKTESIWLPSALVDENVEWRAPDSSTAVARFDYAGDTEEVAYRIREGGGLRSVGTMRWGDGEGGTFALRSFGGTVEAEATYGGYTIPSRVRVGWGFQAEQNAGERFEPDGEFFRAELDTAEFR